MKTYVVNMLKDVAKRQQIEAQLAEHPELDYEIWAAVEGRKLSLEERKSSISSVFISRYGKSASLPAAGCSLSHVEIYRDMINNDVKYALVLEDDARLAKELQLENCANVVNSDIPSAILLTPEFWYMKDALVKQVNDNFQIFRLYNGYMTSGYIINQAGAKLLLSLNFPIQYMADSWHFFIEKGLVLYGIVPHVVSYPDECGEIGMAGNIPTKGWKKYRSKMIMFYFEIIWIIKYFKGCRRSKKIWK